MIWVVVFLSIFSSSIMMYIALATSIGPWIGPLLVLVAPPLLKVFVRKPTTYDEVTAVVGSSIGGILATACAFSFPALYFIDSGLYKQWLSMPPFFIGLVSALCFIAGSFGMMSAWLFEKQFNGVLQGPFPSAQLIFSMIHAADHTIQRAKLLYGGLLYGIFLFMRSLVLWALRAKTLVAVLITNSTVMPMLISIGFVTGHVIAVPLLIGVLIRFFFVDMIRLWWYSSHLPLNFSLAFCTGIILSGLLIGVFKSVRSLISKGMQERIVQFVKAVAGIKIGAKHYLIGFGLLLILSIGYYFDASVFLISYSIVATIIAVYFMVVLAAKTGLAYLGRFATFVMVPAMIIFRCSSVQLIILATFVEVAGGVAVDVLSGRKIVALAGFQSDRFIMAQWIGLFIASIASGFVLWALCSYLQLGSAQLAGYKAHARALLIGVEYFELPPLALGFLVGLICSLSKVNTGTLLGGILMPVETASGLIAGGVLAFCVRNKDSWYPLASGVFAANSLYMIAKAIFYHGN